MQHDGGYEICEVALDQGDIWWPSDTSDTG